MQCCSQTTVFRQKKAGSHLLSRYRSIIGAEVLDFRVRNGNGYCHLAMATGIYYYAFASRIRAFSRAPLSFMYSLLMECKPPPHGEAVVWPSLADY